MHVHQLSDVDQSLFQGSLKSTHRCPLLASLYERELQQRMHLLFLLGVRLQEEQLWICKSERRVVGKETNWPNPQAVKFYETRVKVRKWKRVSEIQLCFVL